MVSGHGRCRIGSRHQVGRRCHPSRSAVVVVAISAVVIRSVIVVSRRRSWSTLIIVVRGHAPRSVLVVAIKVKGGSGRAALNVL